MTQLAFYFDQTRCIGCYTCAVSCKDWHDLEAGPVHWLRIQTIERGRFPDLFAAFLFSPCYHCADPLCLAACPTGAISKRENDGVVLVDPALCLGKDECGARCLKACPYQAPQFGPQKDARMQKCDFCAERLSKGLQPICVEACPMYALEAAPLTDLTARHGEAGDAAGFSYSSRVRPSVIIKPKQDKPESSKTISYTQ